MDRRTSHVLQQPHVLARTACACLCCDHWQVSLACRVMEPFSQTHRTRGKSDPVDLWRLLPILCGTRGATLSGQGGRMWPHSHRVDKGSGSGAIVPLGLVPPPPL